MIENEASIFWNEIAQYLPKTIERAALGDEKIFTAFRLVYPSIRQYLVSPLRTAERTALIEEMKEKLLNIQNSKVICPMDPLHQCDKCMQKKEIIHDILSHLESGNQKTL